jgi:hypothetical protein
MGQVFAVLGLNGNEHDGNPPSSFYFGSLFSILPEAPQSGHLFWLKNSFRLQLAQKNIPHALQCFQFPPPK